LCAGNSSVSIPIALPYRLRPDKHKPKITCNARMGRRELKQYCPLDEATLEMLKFAMADLNFSARAYDRISEAVQYRSLDRQLWT